MKRKNKKDVTLNDLALMVARGFENTATKTELRELESRMGQLEKRMMKLEETVQNIANKLAHYIDIHEERYLDLKHRYRLLARVVEKMAAKTGVRFEALED